MALEEVEALRESFRPARLTVLFVGKSAPVKRHPGHSWRRCSRLKSSASSSEYNSTVRDRTVDEVRLGLDGRTRRMPEVVS